jgi:DNA-binding MarR family transcriptional regulator
MILTGVMCIDFSKHANSGLSAVQIIIYEDIEKSEKILSKVFGKHPLNDNYIQSCLRQIAYVLSMNYSDVKVEFDKLLQKGLIHESIEPNGKGYYIDEEMDSELED